MPAVLEIDHLGKRYGEFEAVRGVSFAVEPGEVFALLGPNGAGKTTTIRMIMGILQPSAGTARLAGYDCFADRVEVKRRVGYLPDEPVFYDYLKGHEIIRFVGEMHGLTGQETRDRANPLLQRFELGGALEEFAVNYSRGMKKKLALVCALLHEPQLLMLDEPTNGLDPFATRAVQELIREYTAAGRSVLFSTHLLEQAERLCDRVGILKQGRLAALGRMEELRADLAPNGSLEDIFFAVAGKADETEA